MEVKTIVASGNKKFNIFFFMCIITFYGKQYLSMKILLSKIMYEHNLSIRQVALLCDLSPATIQKVMKEDSNPTIRTLAMISKGLKVSITDLFDLEE